MGINMQTSWQDTLSVEKSLSRGAHLHESALEECSRLRPWMQSKISPALRKDVCHSSPRMRVVVLVASSKKGSPYTCCAARALRWVVNEGGTWRCAQVTGFLRASLDLLSWISSSELKLLCHSLILHQICVTMKLIRGQHYVLFTQKTVELLRLQAFL